MERRKAGGKGVVVFAFEFSPFAHGPNCGVSVNTSL